MYHIRIDTHIDHPIIAKLYDNSEAYVIAEEGGDQKIGQHCHMFMVTKTPLQTIRNWIRKEGFSGNKSYSISAVKDPVKTVAYILKDAYKPGKKPPLIHMPPPEWEEILKKALEYDGNVKLDIEKKKVKNTLKAMEQNILPFHLSNIGQPYSDTIVMQTIIQHYLDNGLLIRRFQIQALFDTLGVKHSKKFKEDFIKKLI